MDWSFLDIFVEFGADSRNVGGSLRMDVAEGDYVLVSLVDESRVMLTNIGENTGIGAGVVDDDVVSLGRVGPVGLDFDEGAGMNGATISVDRVDVNFPASGHFQNEFLDKDLFSLAFNEDGELIHYSRVS